MKPKNKMDLETFSLFLVLAVLTIAFVILLKVFLFGPDFSMAEMATK